MSDEITTIEVVERYLAEGSKIAAIRGEVRWVGEVKEGITKSGPTKGQKWTIQSLLFVDPDKKKEEEYSSTFLSLKNCEEFDLNFKGKDIVVMSLDGPKGLSGVTVGTYDGKKQIQVTRTAKIMLWEDYASMNATDELERKTDRQEPPKQAVEEPAQTDAQEEPPAENGGDSSPKQVKLNNINLIKRQLNRMKSIYNLCFDAATYQAIDIKKRHGYPFSPAVIEKWATNMFHKTMNETGSLMVNSDEFPLDVYLFSEYKGEQMISLIPELMQSVDDARTHKITHEETVKAAVQNQLAPTKEEERAPGYVPEKSEPEPDSRAEEQRRTYDDIEEDVPF